jgi:hypothetical protein
MSSPRIHRSSPPWFTQKRSWSCAATLIACIIAIFWPEKKRESVHLPPRQQAFLQLTTVELEAMVYKGQPLKDVLKALFQHITGRGAADLQGLACTSQCEAEPIYLCLAPTNAACALQAIAFVANVELTETDGIITFEDQPWNSDFIVRAYRVDANGRKFFNFDAASSKNPGAPRQSDAKNCLRAIGIDVSENAPASAASYARWDSSRGLLVVRLPREDFEILDAAIYLLNNNYQLTIAKEE